MFKTIGTFFKVLWVLFCAIIGAAIGAILLGLQFESMAMAIVGGVIGAGLGALFGKYVPILDVLTD